MRPFLLSVLAAIMIAACTPAADIPPTPSKTPRPTVTDDPAVEQSVRTSTPRPTADVEEPLAFPDDLPQVIIDVELFYTDHWMRITQTVNLTNTTGDVWEEVVFNVPTNMVDNSFYLDRLFVTLADGEPVDVFEPFPDKNNMLRVQMPREVEPEEEVFIEMGYRVLIPPVAPTNWPPIGTTGWTAEVIQAGEFYPALVPYGDEGWETWDYVPVGDPTFYALTDVTLRVTPDNPDVVVASGEPTGKDGDTYVFEVHGARGIAFFASPRYEILEDVVNGITVYSYFRPEHLTAGQEALKVGVESLELFEELFGPYSYQSLTIAENGFFGGMEYSALASITDFAYATYKGEPTSVLHALTAHEVAHQWWYGAVGNHQAREPWLDESLGFYSELLYFERYYPQYMTWWWDARVNQYNPYGWVDATIYDYGTSSDFILLVYGQAAYFMRDLRDQMGDDAFFTFLQDYYVAYYGEIVTSEDFFTMLTDYTTGDDLAPLLEIYFEELPDIQNSETPEGF